MKTLEKTRATNALVLDGRRWSAFRCSNAIVLEDERGDEVLSISKTAIGTASVHAVDDRYERMAIVLSALDIAFDPLWNAVTEDRT